ncbi:galactokinase [Caproicibacter sp.]|uniref:galactokinase n=1 Tax=Caproicibacter sp. TaxID=2814884 RepID=UPI00398A35FE
MKSNDAKKVLGEKNFRETLKERYGVGEERAETCRLRLLRAVEKFEELFGADRDIRVYSAPGRTEIGGNHTDHQGGRVLAAGVDLDAVGVASAGGDGITVHSEGFSPDRLNPAELMPRAGEEGSSAALIRGICAGLAARGLKIGGFRAYTQSDVLPGSGLSSSAAFEVLIGRIADDLFGSGDADPVQIAQIGQDAENRYFGKPCGLMDQTACAVGGFAMIDFQDAKRPAVEKIPFDFSGCGYRLCIIDTKGSHAGLTADYAAIPEEMRRVAACFGKTLLSQVSEEEFYAELARVRSQTGDRAVLRAIHFFGDNRRVAQQAAALRENRFADFLSLVRESGRSSFQYLQNVYSPSRVEEQGVALGLALCERLLSGCGGAWRLHGGGFAGTVQAYVPKNDFDGFRREAEAVFGPGSCVPLAVRTAGAIRIL